MEYEVGIRLDRIEAKVDEMLAQLRQGMSPAEVQQTTQELEAAADALEKVSGADVTRSKPKVGGKR